MLYGRMLIASILALTLINYYFHGYAGQRFVSFLFFAAYVLHLWWPHVLLSRAQREHNHEMEMVINDRDAERP